MIRRGLTAGVLLVVVIVSMGGTVTAEPTPAGGPTIELSTGAATSGQEVTVTGARWPATASLTVMVCGAEGRGGTDTCDVLGGLTIVSDSVGGFRSPMAVRVPPTPCPCAVRAFSGSRDVEVVEPISIVGALYSPPSAGLVEPGTRNTRGSERAESPTTGSFRWPALGLLGLLGLLTLVTSAAAAVAAPLLRRRATREAKHPAVVSVAVHSLEAEPEPGIVAAVAAGAELEVAWRVVGTPWTAVLDLTPTEGPTVLRNLRPPEQPGVLDLAELEHEGTPDVAHNAVAHLEVVEVASLLVPVEPELVIDVDVEPDPDVASLRAEVQALRLDARSGLKRAAELSESLIATSAALVAEIEARANEWLRDATQRHVEAVELLDSAKARADEVAEAAANAAGGAMRDAGAYQQSVREALAAIEVQRRELLEAADDEVTLVVRELEERAAALSARCELRMSEPAPVQRAPRLGGFDQRLAAAVERAFVSMSDADSV